MDDGIILLWIFGAIFGFGILTSVFTFVLHQRDKFRERRAAIHHKLRGPDSDKPEPGP